MATLSTKPGDIIWNVQLVSSATIYQGYRAAKLAAVTLSDGNSNAPVNVFDTQLIVRGPLTGPAGPATPSQFMPGNAFVIDLSSGTTYYPLEAARVAALTLSQANGNAPVVVSRSRCIITGP